MCLVKNSRRYGRRWEVLQREVFPGGSHAEGPHRSEVTPGQALHLVMLVTVPLVHMVKKSSFRTVAVGVTQ